MDLGKIAKSHPKKTIGFIIGAIILLVVLMNFNSAVAIGNQSNNKKPAYLKVTVKQVGNYRHPGSDKKPDMSNKVFVGDKSNPVGRGEVIIPLTKKNGEFIIDKKSVNRDVPGIHINRGVNSDKEPFIDITLYGENNDKSRESVKFDIEFINGKVQKIKNDGFGNPYTKFCGIKKNTKESDPKNDEITEVNNKKVNLCSTTGSEKDKVRIIYKKVKGDFECSKDKDCDDNDDYTEDSCNMKGALPKCVHKAVACVKDKDCDDGNKLTEDRCKKAGAADSYCKNKPIECKKDKHCDDGLFCNGVETCGADNKCDDGKKIDCSGFDLPLINDCNNLPDGNPFTLDTADATDGVCNEIADACEVTPYTFLHQLLIGSCSVECVDDADCGDDEFCNDDYECEDAPECIADAQCDYLDSVSCSGDDAVTTEGVCNAGTCEAVVAEVEECNNGLFCDGVETCNAGACIVEEAAIDCSPFNIDPIGTCNYSPDDNPFTWDHFAGFESSCDEAADSCTTGAIDMVSNPVTVDVCGVECVDNGDCGAGRECDLDNYECIDLVDYYIDEGYADIAYEGQTVRIGFTTHNSGAEMAVPSDIYIDDVLTSIGGAILFLAGDNDLADVYFSSLDVGTHNIRFEIDPENVIDEADETNNIFSFDFEVLPRELEIVDLECFDEVVENNPQSCSMFVEDNLGEKVEGIDVDVYYADDTLFGSCVTDDISGGCSVNDVQIGTGVKEVYAIASKTDYISDDDQNPIFSYNVLEEVYEINNLMVFNDDGFVNEDYDFFRGEDLFVSFDVTRNGVPIADMITKATLISEAGGRIDLDEINNANGDYFYELTPIPITHDFIGDSQIFTFAFDLANGEGGQAEVNLIIRNNVPVITGVINDYTIREGVVFSIDLGAYESDVEDSGDDLKWNVYIDNPYMDVSINGRILTIEGLNEGEGDVTVRLTDLDGDYAEQGFNVEVTPMRLEIVDLECFDEVVENNPQSCSMFVEDDLGDFIGNANVDVYYSDGARFGDCVTDGITGGCEVSDVQIGTGAREVYATASKTGYISDDDQNPRFSYIVLEEVYEIEDLMLFNDEAFSVEDYDFFRGEDLFVSFSITRNGVPISDMISKATLISPPGGRVDLAEISNSNGDYFYELIPIPKTHNFLGDSQVFTFAFDLINGEGGQAEVNLIIRNNVPVITGVIGNQSMNVGESIVIDLSAYESDVEDFGDNLKWVVIGNPLVDVSITGKVLTIEGLEKGDGSITLRLFDLDNDFDEETFNIEINSRSSSGGSDNGNDECNPRWDCSDWSSCVSGMKARSCNDRNSCGTLSFKPSEKIYCESGNIAGLNSIVLNGKSGSAKTSGGFLESLPGFVWIIFGMIIVVLIIIIILLLFGVL